MPREEGRIENIDQGGNHENLLGRVSERFGRGLKFVQTGIDTAQLKPEQKDDLFYLIKLIEKEEDFKKGQTADNDYQKILDKAEKVLEKYLKLIKEVNQKNIDKQDQDKNWADS